MNKLRVVEVYASYQGEGPNTSKPTVFVRFAGCNLKCPGWPCDTQHAIDPNIFRVNQEFLTPEELADRVDRLGAMNVCLTGGEVFLQHTEALREFVGLLRNEINVASIECFTNGTLAWDGDTTDMLDTIIMDWKLPGSGEFQALPENLATLGSMDAIKFTIKDRNDYEEAKLRYENSIATIDKERPLVYAGVVWGAMDTEVLCDWMMKDGLDWNLNVQVHKFVWDPNKIGV